MTIKEMLYIAFFAALISICSWIVIPLTVPITLQTYAVLVTCIILGPKRSLLSIFIYILLGAIGLPVFSNFSGGIGMLLGNTGGYIIGFLFTAATIGLITKICGKKTYVLIISMILGLLVCYLFGTVWFIKVYTSSTGSISIYKALSLCVIPFIIPDGLKILLALLTVKKLEKHISL